LIYALISLIRGFFLLPMTPFVIGGAVLFPDQPVAVIVISMLSILLSSAAIYYFSDLLGFSGKLETHFPKQLATWRERMSHPKAILYVLGSSFIPIFSNEMISYVAGIVKVPFRYVFISIFISSLLLCILYVYFGVIMTNIIKQ